MTEETRKLILEEREVCAMLVESAAEPSGFGTVIESNPCKSLLFELASQIRSRLDPVPLRLPSSRATSPTD